MLLLYTLLAAVPRLGTAKSVIRCTTDGEKLPTREVCSPDYYLCKDVDIFKRDFHKARNRLRCPFPLVFDRDQLDCSDPLLNTGCRKVFEKMGAEILNVHKSLELKGSWPCHDSFPTREAIFSSTSCEAEFTACIGGRTFNARCLDAGHEFRGRRCVPAAKSCWSELDSELDLDVEVAAYNYGPLEDEDICIYREDHTSTIIARECDKFFIQCTDDDSSRIFRCPEGTYVQRPADFPFCKKSQKCFEKEQIREAEGSGATLDSDGEFEKIFGNWQLLEN